MGARHQLRILIRTADDLEAERHALVLQERQRDRGNAKERGRYVEGGIAGPGESDRRRPGRSQGDKSVEPSARVGVALANLLPAAKRGAIIVEGHLLRGGKAP